MSLFIEYMTVYSDVDYTCFLIGDFHCPNVDWVVSTASDDGFQLTFLTCTSKLGFTQFIDKPTRKNNILDLIFSSDPIIVSSFSVDCAFGTSDHATILFFLLLSNSHTFISNTDFSQSNSTDAHRPDF